MTDRTTRGLLFAIAIGLWANVATEWFRPVPVQAQGASEIVLALGAVRNAVQSVNVDLLTIGKDVLSIEANVKGIREEIR